MKKKWFDRHPILGMSIVLFICFSFMVLGGWLFISALMDLLDLSKGLL